MAVMAQTPGGAVNPAKKSLLALVAAACGELGLAAPNSIVGNTDQQAIQLLALANREGQQSFQEGTDIEGWQMLRKEYVFNIQSTGLISVNLAQNSNVINFNAVPAITPQIGWVVSNSGSSYAGAFPYPTKITAINSPTQVVVSNVSSVTSSNTSVAFGQDTYSFPSDVDHLIPQTMWDRSFRWQLLGPMSPQEWQVLKSGISPTGPRRRFRVIDGSFVVDPVPYDNNQIVYEYYSNAWVQDGISLSLKTSFQTDTDIYLLDDDTMILGIIWRFRRAKGLDYDQEYQSWRTSLDRYKARQATARTLPINAEATGVRLLNNMNVPDTGFGS